MLTTCVLLSAPMILSRTTRQSVELSVIPASLTQRPSPLGVTGVDQPAGAALASPLWEFQSGGELVAAPLHDDETLYLGDDAGFIYAVDDRTGHGRWSVSTAGRIIGPPTVFDAVLYAPNDDFVTIDTARGTLLLQVQSDRRQVSGLTAVDGMVIVTGLRIPTGFVQAMNPVTAVEQWRVDLPGIVVGPPQRAGDRIIVATAAGEVVAIEYGSGHVAWRVPVPGAVGVPPTVSSDSIFLVATQGARSLLIAIDRVTGRERWEVAVAGPSRLSPTIMGTLVATTSGTTVTASDTATSRIVWRHEQARSITATALGPDQTLLIGDDGGTLTGIDPLDGSDRWSWRSPQRRAVTGLATAGGVVYVTSGRRLIAITPPP